MARFTAPGWRIVGSVTSWVLFTFSFLGLYQAAAVVSGLGGFCASGGPYVIATECPASVIVFAPLGIFGMLFAAAIGLVLARGFGTPLIVWGWPILFVGLGVGFFLAGLRGNVTSWIIAILFVAMGAVPLVFEVRAGLARVLLGSHNVRDERFRDRDDAPSTMYSFGRSDPGETVPATGTDWALSLGILVLSLALGAWLSLNAFNAVASAG